VWKVNPSPQQWKQVDGTPTNTTEETDKGYIHFHNCGNRQKAHTLQQQRKHVGGTTTTTT